MEELKQKWDLIIQTLKEDYDITDMSFRTWIKPIQVYSVVGDKITLLIPENNNDSDGKGLSYNMRVGYIERKYLAAITLTIAEIMGREYDVTLMSSIDKEKIDKKQKQKDTSASKNNNIQNLNPNYTFETFVIGNNNNLAHAASLAVAETPGEVYNPLFIYGGVGLGKTHLMQAIAHFIIKTKPELKVLYVTSETFTNELIDSVKNQKNSEFREKYRNIDVLLIDDIQFIIGKEGTQEEFFHTFNTLYENKKQIVIASDKPPKDIDNLEDRLRSRFEVGLIVDIQMPDFETRMAILRKKEELMNVNIDNEIIKYIATNIKSNIRELEGALTKIVAMSRLKGQSIDLALAEDLLKDHITPDGPKEVTPELIITTVAEHFGITNLEIASQKKSKEIVYPRQLAMYLCRTMTEAPLKTIGEYLGGRDHTTIMHGIDKISTELRTNEQLKSTIETLKKKISP